MRHVPDDPYRDLFEPESIRVGRGFAWVAVVLFLAVCVLPPLARHLSQLSLAREQAAAAEANGGVLPPGIEPAWVPAVEFWRPQGDGDGGLVGHLRAFESTLEDAPITEAPRRAIQDALLRTFDEGNTKTVVGTDGWLFFRPAVEALVGTGPLAPPALGPASDPGLKRWEPALPVIRRFAAQLAERGIELMLVPVPVKPMIAPEHLTGRDSDSPLRHPDEPAFFAALEEAGVSVVDLAPLLWSMKESGETFLRQDTHWRPEAMAAAAEAVAERIRGRDWVGEARASSPLTVRRERLVREHVGDLVEKLDLPPGSNRFPPEPARLERIVDAATGERPAGDRDSPVVLLGDSFVNIFDDPGIGFGPPQPADGDPADPAPRIGAGFAQHLAAALGMRLDVIARNGQAATGVRQELAARFGQDLRRKKLVVWTIAARDLLYSPKLAAENQVAWKDVEWNTAEAPATTVPEGGLLVEATLDRHAAVPDPRKVNYPSTLYQTVWKDIEVVESRGGPDTVEPEGGEIAVELWAMRDRTIVPTGRLRVGERHRLVLRPKDAVPALADQRVETFDDEVFFEVYFGELAPE